MNMIALVAMMVASQLAFSAPSKARDMASVRPHTFRVNHARELLGSNYGKTISLIRKDKNIEPKIFVTVKKRLPAKFKWRAREITRTIITESHKHKLDPYFVMALIAGESSFNPEARGPVGEIGLMQIRMTTGEWMAKKARLKWSGKSSLENPVSNIKIGTAYIAYLREKFSREGQLYLAAYNMGARSVKRALGKNIRPKDYPIHVMKRYIAFYRDI